VPKARLTQIPTHSLEFKQFVKRFDLLFSPRTTLLKKREQERSQTDKLIKYFDPFTLNFLKREFEAMGGCLDRAGFIGCLRGHLLQWRPQEPAREDKLSQFLSYIFDDIDIAHQGKVDWEQFSSHLISKASGEGRKKRGGLSQMETD